MMPEMPPFDTGEPRGVARNKLRRRSHSRSRRVKVVLSASAQRVRVICNQSNLPEGTQIHFPTQVDGVTSMML
jgi:hypothetical protein